ncbi:MAG: hypothetical protein Q8N04_04515 [Nitrospira sp.]|nr:hypothetical protein [Nitrospira sp.]
MFETDSLREAKMLFDTADPMIKRFDAVMELRVGQFQERAQFSKFLIHVFMVFGMPAIEMHLKSLGDRLDIVAKSFNQYTSMTFDVLSGHFRGLAERRHVLTEFRRRGVGGLAERRYVLAKFRRRGVGGLAERRHVVTQRRYVLAEAFGNRCHDPFNLCQGFGIHSRPLVRRRKV